jgi:hypothetical protein
VKIGWIARHTRLESFSERIWVWLREQQIGAALAADGRRAFRARRRGAKRPCAVRWIHYDFIAQSEYLLVERVIELMRETGGVLVSEKISA